MLSVMKRIQVFERKVVDLPENDSDNHYSDRYDVSDDPRSPGDSSVAPDNLIRAEPDDSGRHV